MKKINFYFMDFLIGLILIICGVLLLKYRYHVYHFTGDWGWAQQYLGGNGTVVAIAFVGMFLIFMGVAFPFGVFKNDKPTPSQGPVNQNYTAPNPFQSAIDNSSGK